MQATIEPVAIARTAPSARCLGPRQCRVILRLDVSPFDGKTFAEDEMVAAVGVAITGEQVLLGFVQTATENRPA